MYCSALFLGLGRRENLHYWILLSEGVFIMLPWSFLLNNFRHRVSYLIFVEFIMQAIFWKLQSNLWGSLCCKCCWYFYGKWYKIGIWLSSYCARHFVSLTFPSTRVFFCIIFISWHFFLLSICFIVLFAGKQKISCAERDSWRWS